ncbi:MAG: class I SAM-dependent methyltransferase, partial [Actinobacteria bacterium]|nr:class I SAM-dependent methyltransferase [Actinomycetota bacterium]
MLLHCLLCGAPSIRETKKRRALIWEERKYTFYSCGNCACLSLHPLLTQADIRKLYSSEYEKANRSDTNDSQTYFVNHGYRFSLSFLKEQLKGAEKLLDFGCGVDSTVVDFVLHNNAHYVGVEPSEEVVEKLRSKRPSAEYWTLEEFSKNKILFDYIFCGDVFEH